MIKKFLIWLVLMGGVYAYVHSQSVQVTGTVRSQDDSSAIPGATVIVKGTTIGTITNLDGEYSLEVPADAQALQFRFVGMKPKDIPFSGQQTINLYLEPDVYKMEEAVVTALGIRRESKALGYSATSVSSEEITKARDRSVLNSLQSKVAGVNISTASGAPGASTRIIMRGISSLGGSNQPLFIVDGVPVSNSSSGSTSINGGTDFGNKANDINPEDIESITVLKGAAGTALYGSRAANGVIVITTKKGEAQAKGSAKINVSSSVGFESPLRLVKYQNEFGQGIHGNAVLYENMSWGPRFDDLERIWGNKVDEAYRIKPYTGLNTNVEEFFDVGKTFNNSISISGGNEQQTYYLSYSNLTSNGIFPTNADSYNRNTIALRSSYTISDKFKSSASLNYINKKNSFVPTGQGEQSVYNQIMQTPRDISLLELQDIESQWNDIDNFYSRYTVNPYFILKRNGNDNNEDRFYGSLDLEYHFSSALQLNLRLGGDISNENRERWREIIEPEGNNEFAAISEPGMRGKITQRRLSLNADLLLNYQKQFGDFDVGAVVGYNLNESQYTSLSTQVNGLVIEGFPQLSNSSEKPSSGEYFQQRRLTGVFSTVDVGYKSMLFLTLTARNDWSSTLPKQNNSFFYPGANIGFVFTELIPAIQPALPFGKLRFGWAQVGNDAPPYSINNSFVNGFHSDGFGFFSYPLINGVNSYEVGNLIGNQELRPEMSTEYEIGTDLRFFSNRIGIDLTYYNRTVNDLIWAAPLARTSGYSSQLINLGEITNKGMEILLNITPLQTTNFSWDVSLNYTKNNNLLVRLNDDLEEVVITGFGVEGGQQIQYIGRPGEPIGIFKARAPKYDDRGQMIVDNTGLPVAADELKEYGNSQYDYMAGLTNNFSFKNVSLGFTFDIRQGGLMYSRTKDISVWAGTVPVTLYNLREPFIIPNAVYEVDQDQNGDPVYAENTIPLDAVHLVDYWGEGGTELDGFSLIDKSYVKLREVVFAYSLPSRWMNKLPIERANISVIGKNLWLSTPQDQTYIDPEITTFGNDLAADFGEYGATPSVKSYTVSLRLTF
jgi:TonB-linked SusC/RagA family outer membrane protein